ncbi:MAG: S66 peptidase family protein [Myxococcota bacterium]|nr:S66 peptidase family protein [Myxococcota bacterium]
MQPTPIRDPLLPPPLKPGEAIGYFSPSSPATHFAPTRYERARAYLQGKGFSLVSGSLSGQADHYRSGSIQERADELNALIANPDVRCIMSTIGGANSNSLLPYIDYAGLRADPKIIIGYSDATSILLAIHQKTGLVTFYGPALVASFGEYPPLVDETFDAFAAVVMAEDTDRHTCATPEFWTDEMIPWEEQDRPKTLVPNHCEFLGTGTICGRLIGGNLNTLWSLWGSPYMPPVLEGDVLLIEDSLKPISTVERLFAFLKLNGVFDRVSAVILGKHEKFDDGGTGRAPMDVLREVLNGQNVPIINGFDCCHTHPMLTMPLGVQVCVDFDHERVEISEQWLR